MHKNESPRVHAHVVQIEKQNGSAHNQKTPIRGKYGGSVQKNIVDKFECPKPEEKPGQRPLNSKCESNEKGRYLRKKSPQNSDKKQLKAEAEKHFEKLLEHNKKSFSVRIQNFTEKNFFSQTMFIHDRAAAKPLKPDEIADEKARVANLPSQKLKELKKKNFNLSCDKSFNDKLKNVSMPNDAHNGSDAAEKYPVSDRKFESLVDRNLLRLSTVENAKADHSAAKHSAKPKNSSL